MAVNKPITKNNLKASNQSHHHDGTNVCWTQSKLFSFRQDEFWPLKKSICLMSSTRWQRITMNRIVRVGEAVFLRCLYVFTQRRVQDVVFMSRLISISTQTSTYPTVPGITMGSVTPPACWYGKVGSTQNSSLTCILFQSRLLVGGIWDCATVFYPPCILKTLPQGRIL